MNAACSGCGLSARAETLDRQTFLPAALRDGHLACAHRVAVDDDRARAALAEPAAELRAGQPQRVPQHVEQRLISVAHLDRPVFTVDVQREGRHGLSLFDRAGTDDRLDTVPCLLALSCR